MASETSLTSELTAVPELTLDSEAPELTIDSISKITVTSDITVSTSELALDSSPSMAPQTTITAPNTPSDPTFRLYSPTQAHTYATSRQSYAPQLYNIILDFHTSAPPPGSPPSSNSLLLDVGCGPGNATRDVAPHFKSAIAVDPSPYMIETAKELGGKTGDGGDVQWRVGEAEKLSEVEGLVGDDGVGKVNLLIAATAAHWFDMSHFWPEAARVVKPGGTIALWTISSLYCHPDTPDAAEIQKQLSDLEDVDLKPYENEGNRLARDMYARLPLPWSINPPVPSLPSSSFRRLEFDRAGVLSNGIEFLNHVFTKPTPQDSNPEAQDSEDVRPGEISLDELEGRMATASMVTRWRQDPDNEGKEDPVRKRCRMIGEVVGREGKGKRGLRAGTGMGVLLFKRV